MKKILITIGITGIVILGGVWLYNTLRTPIMPIGASITTIQGTDKLSDSRITINDNFASLNAGKIENSTTTLPLITTLSNLATVGTLTSGSLGTGFTDVPVAQGGTGASTLNANQVLLGNGTSAITKVSGFGTSGQFLTSNGNGIAPTWQTSAVDTAIDYHWTGFHIFDDAVIASSTITTLEAPTGSITNLTSSGTQTLNGIDYTFPATESASSTVLATDGSGGLSWKEDRTDIDTCAGNDTIPSGTSDGTVAQSCSFAVHKVTATVDCSGAYKGVWAWTSGGGYCYGTDGSGRMVGGSGCNWEIENDADTTLSISGITSSGFNISYNHHPTYPSGGCDIYWVGTK